MNIKMQSPLKFCSSWNIKAYIKYKLLTFRLKWIIGLVSSTNNSWVYYDKSHWGTFCRLVSYPSNICECPVEVYRLQLGLSKWVKNPYLTHIYLNGLNGYLKLKVWVIIGFKVKCLKQMGFSGSVINSYN